MLLTHALFFSFFILFPHVAHHLGRRQLYDKTRNDGIESWNGDGETVTQNLNIDLNPRENAVWLSPKRHPISASPRFVVLSSGDEQAIVKRSAITAASKRRFQRNIRGLEAAASIIEKINSQRTKGIAKTAAHRPPRSVTPLVDNQLVDDEDFDIDSILNHNGTAPEGSFFSDGDIPFGKSESF